MKAEIINIGTELILGDVINTHHSFIARQLAQYGIDTYHQCCVGDNPARIGAAVRLAVQRSELIIITGGLGPTEDDISKKSVCDAIGKKLVYNEASAQRIKQYFERQGRSFTQSNYNQAYLPQDSIILNNEYGTAPGCITKCDGFTVIMLPGPPRELIPMWNSGVVPFLQDLCGGIIFSENIRTFGISESKVDALISSISLPEGVTVAPYAKSSEVLVRVTAKASSEAEAKKLLSPISCKITDILGDTVYGINCSSLAERCVGLLNRKGKKVAVAESCTGGLIAKMITDIPGSSSVFELGAVCYSESQKNALLSVPLDIIEKYGVVSSSVAESMALGVKRRAGADFGLATTGIAGPGGGTPQLPVGTVWVAIACENGVFSRRLNLQRERPDREYVRNYSALYALNMLRKELE